MHYRIPYTFRAACSTTPLPNGIHWTSDVNRVTCEACIAAIKLPELEGKCQICGHDMIKRDVPLTITEDWSIMADVKITPQIYTVCDMCYEEYHHGVLNRRG